MIMGGPTILVLSARDIEGCTSQASFNQNSDSSNVLKHTTRKDSLTVCGNFLIVSRKLHFVNLHSKGVASVGRCFSFSTIRALVTLTKPHRFGSTCIVTLPQCCHVYPLAENFLASSGQHWIRVHSTCEMCTRYAMC